MAQAQPRQFGQPPPGGDAVERPGAYGVVVDRAQPERVLLVRWRGRWFLPGGGVGEGETARQALARELLEETGYELRSAEPLGQAGQYVGDPATGRCLNKTCTFFAARTGARIRDPAERDHRSAWVPAREAAGLLHEEASAWAVRQVT